MSREGWLKAGNSAYLSAPTEALEFISVNANTSGIQQDSICSQAERSLLQDRDVANSSRSIRSSVDHNSWKAEKKISASHTSIWYFERASFTVQNNYVPGQTVKENSENTEIPL